MRAKHSRFLVVDASVAHPAGDTEHPVSRSCREALIAIRDICHRVVMTEAIREEWKRHMSGFTIKWRSAMVAKKKIVPPPREGIQLNHVDDACRGLSTAEQDGLRKDLCLIEAACAADGIIVTRDDAIQRIWHKCHNRLGLPKPIAWINPVTDGVEALEHL